MEFGVQFFPSVGPDRKSAEQYWTEALQLTQRAEQLGYARAFLPPEFAGCGISMDESRARFDEGLEQIRRLLEEENVTAQGRFHSFEKVASLPRPTQKPRPPFWIAALSTKDSFENAGR